MSHYFGKLFVSSVNIRLACKGFELVNLSWSVCDDPTLRFLKWRLHTRSSVRNIAIAVLGACVNRSLRVDASPNTTWYST